MHIHPLNSLGLENPLLGFLNTVRMLYYKPFSYKRRVLSTPEYGEENSFDVFFNIDSLINYVQSMNHTWGCGSLIRQNKFELIML